jgi:hypothetical protein
MVSKYDDSSRFQGKAILITYADGKRLTSNNLGLHASGIDWRGCQKQYAATEGLYEG